MEVEPDTEPEEEALPPLRRAYPPGANAASQLTPSGLTGAVVGGIGGLSGSLSGIALTPSGEGRAPSAASASSTFTPGTPTQLVFTPGTPTDTQIFPELSPNTPPVSQAKRPRTQPQKGGKKQVKKITRKTNKSRKNKSRKSSR